MRKISFLLCGIFGLLAVISVGYLIFEAMTTTDPYVVRASLALTAPDGTKRGYSVDNKTRTLSVFSDEDIVIVADPGKAFQYEMLWIVERPKKDLSGKLIEYRYVLPKYASIDHINPLGSKVPDGILATAENSWN